MDVDGCVQILTQAVFGGVMWTGGSGMGSAAEGAGMKEAAA